MFIGISYERVRRKNAITIGLSMNDVHLPKGSDHDSRWEDSDCERTRYATLTCASWHFRVSHGEADS